MAKDIDKKYLNVIGDLLTGNAVVPLFGYEVKRRREAIPIKRKTCGELNQTKVAC